MTSKNEDEDGDDDSDLGLKNIVLTCFFTTKPPMAMIFVWTMIDLPAIWGVNDVFLFVL